MVITSDNSQAIDELNHFSAEIGANPLLIQGAGGNVSLKSDTELLVKASGKWLAHAHSENIFVRLCLEPLRKAITDERLEDFSQFIIGSDNLQPSIETSFHALLPHRVVAHTHSIDVLTWVVQKNSQKLLSKPLRNFPWCWVPYRRPGLPLTEALLDAFRGEEQIFLLENHGLIVAANTLAEVKALQSDVLSSLAVKPRSLIVPDIDHLKSRCQEPKWRLPQHAETHSLATDPFSFAQASAPALYPDHVIFLERSDLPNQYDLIEGAGLLVTRDISPGAEEMLRCQALLLARIQPEMRLQYLSEQDRAVLLNWDAEKYRQKLDKA